MHIQWQDLRHLLVNTSKPWQPRYSGCQQGLLPAPSGCQTPGLSTRRRCARMILSRGAAPTRTSASTRRLIGRRGRRCGPSACSTSTHRCAVGGGRRPRPSVAFANGGILLRQQRQLPPQAGARRLSRLLYGGPIYIRLWLTHGNRWHRRHVVLEAVLAAECRRLVACAGDLHRKTTSAFAPKP